MFTPVGKFTVRILRSTEEHKENMETTLQRHLQIPLCMNDTIKNVAEGALYNLLTQKCVTRGSLFNLHMMETYAPC